MLENFSNWMKCSWAWIGLRLTSKPTNIFEIKRKASRRYKCSIIQPYAKRLTSHDLWKVVLGPLKILKDCGAHSQINVLYIKGGI
jgi:hypothetical protein